MRELSLREISGVSGSGPWTSDGRSGVDRKLLGVMVVGSAATAVAYSAASEVLESFQPKMMVAGAAFGWVFPIITDVHLVNPDEGVGTRVCVSGAVGAFTAMCGALALDEGSRAQRRA
ncbi:hypothetical protein [Bordetella genomosp. 4]|nr:hypothetical protein [Bordetella genomosp. 4]OZI45267.1 hypothetical protein CAL21_16290 [Bordetella genomosp. 4]